MFGISITWGVQNWFQQVHQLYKSSKQSTVLYAYESS